MGAVESPMRRVTAGGQLAGIARAEFEKSGVILRGPGKQVQNRLKHSQIGSRLFSNRDDATERTPEMGS
jgi:hypothetical protein